MNLRVSFMIASVALASVSFAHAQETTAGGSLQMETSWNALRLLVDGANNNARTAQILANAIRTCGIKGMFYSPGVAGVDGDSCKAPPTPSPGFSRVTYYGSSDYSPNKIVTSGWHTLCVFAFNHNDSNFWLSVIAGPNADGKSRWQASRGAGGAEPRILCLD
jgi:hypothetical protein